MVIEGRRPAAVDAASWLLAAAIAEQAHGITDITSGSSGNGTYDELVLRSGAHGPTIRLNRNGRGHFFPPNGDSTPFTPDDVWTEIISGRTSVATMANAATAMIDAEGVARRSEPDKALPTTARIIAEALRLSTLFSLEWTAHSGRWAWAWDARDEIRTDLYSSFPSVEVPSPNAVGIAEAARHWFIVNASEEPVALFDLKGVVTLASTGEAISFMTTYTDMPPWQVAHNLFSEDISRIVKAQPPLRPGLGMTAVLSSFNRKERYFLLGAATDGLDGSEIDGLSMRAGSRFRQQLSSATGHDVPEHAFVAMDYHLDWLHAALCWSCGKAYPGQAEEYPSQFCEGRPVITGTQEDVDLLVAWVGSAGLVLVMVEAKAYTGWSTAQMQSKLARLESIIADARHMGAEIEATYIVAGPTESKVIGQLHSVDARPISFTRLAIPGSRIFPQRVDELGRSSNTGERWRILGPTRSVIHKDA